MSRNILAREKGCFGRCRPVRPRGFVHPHSNVEDRREIVRRRLRRAAPDFVPNTERVPPFFIDFGHMWSFSTHWNGPDRPILPHLLLPGTGPAEAEIVASGGNRQGSTYGMFTFILQDLNIASSDLSREPAKQPPLFPPLVRLIAVIVSSSSGAMHSISQPGKIGA